MKRLLLFSLLLPLFAFSQSDSLPDKYHFLGLSFGGGPAFGVGPLSKNSPEENQLGKYNSGGSFRLNVEGILKEKFGIGLGLDYGFYKLSNQVLSDSIAAHFAGKKVHSMYLPEEVLTVVGRFYLSFSGYFKLGARFILQPKLDFGGGLISYDYGAVISYDEKVPYDSWIDGTTSSFATIVPELNIKYIIAKGKWTDLALDAGINYYYFTPVFSITEFKGETFASFSTYETTEFMKVEGPFSCVGTHLGVTWLFKLRHKK